jgi:serine/threonine protein kinase
MPRDFFQSKSLDLQRLKDNNAKILLDESENSAMTRLAPLFRDCDDFEEVGFLGKGSCGEVFSCRDKQTGALVAQKRLYPIANAKDHRSFIREIIVPLQLNLPGIVKLLGFCYPEVFDEENCPRPRGGMVVTELMPNGSLSDVLDKWLSGKPPPGFGPTELSKCIFGVAATMAQVHMKGRSTGI